MDGFINLDKPLGPTSHDMVAYARRVLRQAGLRQVKVGHAGTLDPSATGVLLLCLGRATRLSEYVMAHDKTYVAHIRLGESTTTYDAEGQVIGRHDASGVDLEQVEAVLPRFIGQIDQLPPIYSAIKQDGRKLYELARAGEAVELVPRAVRIDRLTVLDWSNPELALEIVCSSGTYVRSLAHDLGQALGVGAHLVALRRTRSGRFDVAQACTLKQLTDVEALRAQLVSPSQAFGESQMIRLNAAQIAELRLGRPIIRSAEDERDWVLALDEEGAAVAVLRPGVGRWWPHKVLA
ncbi:MAG: tRNA pseudouridine(55) synthase TruB [Anaerolineae bacterium]|nr:tRNA pseudouridine(55) synthase TruB [Anaerolineae bacterium]MDW8171487.1 tRNA pseudouridine(55) synthase TruB [Anaerolineae bacterium]